MNTPRAVAVAVVVGLALLLLTWLFVGGDGESVEGVAPQAKPPPSAKPAPKIRPVPAAIRAALPPPAGIAPPVRRDQPDDTNITPDDRRMMNFAVDGVLRAARAECIEPWLREEGEGDEFVIDAVLYDGQLYDVGIRAMGRTLPADVLECIADRAWYADWPEWDLKGELRLQRAFEVPPP